MGLSGGHDGGFSSVLLATPDLGLQRRLREDLGRSRCAVLPLASLDETGKVAEVVRFDHIILDLNLCPHPADLAEFTSHLEPGQRLVLLREPDRALPATGLNPRCRFRMVTRTDHPGILMNRLRSALEAESRSLQVGSLTRRNLSVLLVDPDPVAQDLILHHLLAHGCMVLSNPDPVEALETAKDICFDVLLAEAMLPFGGSRRLADTLCRINPRLKVLFLASQADDALARSGVCPPGSRILRRPLRRRDILDALESLVKDGPEWKRLSADSPSALPAQAPDREPEDTPGGSGSA